MDYGDAHAEAVRAISPKPARKPHGSPSYYQPDFVATTSGYSPGSAYNQHHPQQPLLSKVVAPVAAAGQPPTSPPGKPPPTSSTNTQSLLELPQYSAVQSFEELNAERIKAIKSTVAKTVICVELSRSFTELIVIVRPVVFGAPIEVEHTPSCQEALLILVTVFCFASWVLYLVGKMCPPTKWEGAALVTTSCFMWSGATFSPTAATCLATYPGHPLLAVSVYTLIGSLASILVLLAEGWAKDKGMMVIAQALSLVSMFIVLSAAAMFNKAFGPTLPWMSPEYISAYLNEVVDSTLVDFIFSDGTAPMARSEATVLAAPTDGADCTISASMLPSPFVVSLMWALVCNGVFVRVVDEILVGKGLPEGRPIQLAYIQFFIKFLAFFTGFQFLAAVKIGWQLLLDTTAPPEFGMLCIQGATAFLFACAYIRFGAPLKGIPGLGKGQDLPREQVDKAFHDTAIGQSIGVHFTPIFQQALDKAVLYGGTLEVMFMGHQGAAAEEAKHKQDWELLAAVIYVFFVTTPMAFWLYYTFIVVKVTPAADKQNAAAAADDGGGDDGGGDDGGGD